MNSPDKDFFPGFIEDDKPPAKATFPAPVPPATPPANEKGFNPFAEETPPAKPSLGPKPLASAPQPKPQPQREANIGAKIMGEMAASSGPDSENEADIKPGQGKDLWTCPHCGAKNKPNRSECRSCGKKPTDPVAKPWYQQPLPLAGIGVGVIVLMIVISMFSGADVSHQTPRVGAIGRSVSYIAGGGQSPVESFTVGGRMSVVGRLIEIKHLDDTTSQLLLALGEQAQSPDKISSIFIDGNTLKIQSQVGSVDIPMARLLCTPRVEEKMSPLSVISVSGVYGHIGTWHSNPEAGLWVLAQPRISSEHP